MIETRLNIEMGKKKIKSIRHLSMETGISRASLTKLYDGDAKGVEFVTLNTLCAYFGCSVSDLIEYKPDKPKAD